jgi:hypothetical protein
MLTPARVATEASVTRAGAPGVARRSESDTSGPHF